MKALDVSETRVQGLPSAGKCMSSRQGLLLFNPHQDRYGSPLARLASPPLVDAGGP
jgi:hypothetical protein